MAKTPLARTSLRLTSQCRQGRAIGWIPRTPQLASQDNPICFVPGGVDSIFFPLRADWVASVMLVVLGKKSLAGSLEGLGGTRQKPHIGVNNHAVVRSLGCRTFPSLGWHWHLAIGRIGPSAWLAACLLLRALSLQLDRWIVPTRFDAFELTAEIWGK